LPCGYPIPGLYSFSVEAHLTGAQKPFKLPMRQSRVVPFEPAVQPSPIVVCVDTGALVFARAVLDD
jgi:hypothetical protein